MTSSAEYFNEQTVMMFDSISGDYISQCKHSKCSSVIQILIEYIYRTHCESKIVDWELFNANDSINDDYYGLFFYRIQTHFYICWDNFAQQKVLNALMNNESISVQCLLWQSMIE